MADQPPAPETKEIAQIAGGRDITRGYVDDLPYLFPQDKTLRHRLGSYEVYADLLQDDRVHSALTQRRSAVVCRPVRVIPGGDADLDAQAAAHLEATLERIRWRTVCDRMLYAVWYGYSVAEALWRREGAMVELEAVRVRDRRRFVFGTDFQPLLRTYADPQGEALPERKFWVLSTGADHDDEPYGRGLAHWVYWLVWFRKHLTQFWLTAADKFGAPTGLGKHRRGAGEEEKQALLAALEQMRSHSAVVVPEDAAIELLQAARSGAMDFAAFRAALDSAITMTILGQTMTSEDGASLSQAQVHMDVRREIVEADAHLITDSFNRQLGRWLTEWNFPGAAVPRVEIAMPEEARLKAQADRDLVISQMGYRPSRTYLTDTYGLELDEQPIPPAAPPGPPAPPALAEGGEEVEDGEEGEGDPLETALEAVNAEDWEALAAPLIQPILDRAKADPEGLMEDVAALWPELDADGLRRQLAQVLFVADAWERRQAQDDGGEAGA